MEATVNIVLESWRKNKEGLYPVKLRIIHNRKPKYYSIKHFVKNNDWAYCKSQEEFDSILSVIKGAKKDIRLNYEEIERKAAEAINNIGVFSFEQFESKLLNKTSNWDYLYNAFSEQIQELQSSERLGYAASFSSTLTAVKYFMENKPFPKGIQSKDHENFKRFKKLKFVDVTQNWLKGFERFLYDNGKSTSTIGIYTRNIRVLFNKAINDYKIKAEYPFDKYSPKTSSNYKRALTIEQVNAIAKYQALEETPEQFAKDMFVFSFLANGMNITDILRLKNKNIRNGEIEFVRFKTKEKKTEIKVSVSLTPTLKRIIARHGNKPLNENVPVFKTINGLKDEKTVYRLIRQKNKQINYHLKSIAQKVGIEQELARKISLAHARHSYATISKNNGEAIEYIKESLGHSTSATTEKYLSSFGSEHRAKASEKLDRKIEIA